MTNTIETSRKSNTTPAGTRGFTLIELLVVISIIALLVSILLPSLSKAKDLAAKAGCMATLNGIGKGWVIYRDTNNGLVPYKDKDGNLFENMPMPIVDAPDQYTVMEAMDGVVDLNNWKCPSQAGGEYFKKYGTSYSYFMEFLSLFMVAYGGASGDDAAAEKAVKISDEHATAIPIFMDAYDSEIKTSHPVGRRDVQNGVVMYWDTHVEFCEGDIAEKMQTDEGFISVIQEIVGS